MAEVIKYNDFGYVLHHGRSFGKGYTIGMAVFDLTDPVKDEKDPDYEFGYRHLRGLDLFWDVGTPTEKDMTVKAVAVLSGMNLDAMKAIPVIEVQYTESEVKAMLIEKGYLTTEQKLTDLKTASELVATEALK